MRRTFIATAIMLLASACGKNVSFGGGTPVETSGVNGQRGFDATGFDRVELAGPFDVVVTAGAQHSVRAEGDTGLMERLDVRVESGRLRIGLQSGYSFSGSDGRVTVHVTAPALAGTEIAGSGSMRVGPVRAARFTGAVTGSGTLTLERLQAEAIQLDIAGSGDIEAAGASREARLEIVGSGNARLDALQSENAHVSIAGSGDAAVRASGLATVEILGSGDVTVSGGARCDVSRMGSGDVRCG